MPNTRPIGMDQFLITVVAGGRRSSGALATFYTLRRSVDSRGSTVMRIIAGKFRRRMLRAPRGLDVRPTSDRLRETLFNVLTAGNQNALQQVVWLDLFAGSGAVGIEAISRGARSVHFVESSPAAAEAIRNNLRSLQVEEGFEVSERPVKTA